MTTPAVSSEAPAAGNASPTGTPVETPAPAVTLAPASADTSLLPAAPGGAPAEPAKEPAKAPVSVTPPDNNPEWFYADGAPGKGKMPDWFKADRYKTVDKQAEAYTHLEKRFGSFTGAPESDYVFKAPEGLNVELDNEHPLLKEMQKWGKEHQLSQAGYNEILGMLAQYEAAMLPDMAAIKQSLGADADTRIQNVVQWAHANLGKDGYGTLRAALSQHNAAEVFTVVEKLIGKTVQTPMPKPGEDVPAAQPGGEAAILARMRVKGPDGKARYFTDPNYRHEVDNQLAEFYRQNTGT
jgi:hypothetical protein